MERASKLLAAASAPDGDADGERMTPRDDLWRTAREKMEQAATGSSQILDELLRLDVRHLDWYVQDKIIRRQDKEEIRDHLRVFKYAYRFARKDAVVWFLRESPPAPRPDLHV